MASYRERCSCIEQDINLGSIDNCQFAKFFFANSPKCGKYDDVSGVTFWWHETLECPRRFWVEGHTLNHRQFTSSQVYTSCSGKEFQAPNHRAVYRNSWNGRPEMEWISWCVCSDRWRTLGSASDQFWFTHWICFALLSILNLLWVMLGLFG